MQREQNTIGVLSQIGKTLETFYNWIIFDYPEQKDYHFQYNKKKNTELNLKNANIYSYLNTYTRNMLDKKIAYYDSNDYKVHFFLKHGNNNIQNYIQKRIQK